MSESVKRVRSFVEIGAVAVHESGVMTEDHIAVQDLCVSYTVLVKTKRLRVLQIDQGLSAYAQCTINNE